MQLQNFTKVDFPHNALYFMIWQQFVNTYDSLGLLALFSTGKLTKCYGFHHMACFLCILFGDFAD